MFLHISLIYGNDVSFSVVPLLNILALLNNLEVVPWRQAYLLTVHRVAKTLVSTYPRDYFEHSTVIALSLNCTQEATTTGFLLEVYEGEAAEADWAQCKR
jgi:hypothetical protein